MSKFQSSNTNSSPSFFAQLAISESRERGKGQSLTEGNSQESIGDDREGVASGSRRGGHTLVACGSRGGSHAGVPGASRGRGHIGSVGGGHEGVASGSRGVGHTLVANGSRGGGHTLVSNGSRGGGHALVTGRSRGGDHTLVACGSRGGGHILVPCGSRDGGHILVPCGSRDGGHTRVADRPRGGDHEGISGGSRGGLHGRAAGRTSDRIDALGKLLVRILRHLATKLKLDMRSDGYVKVRDLLRMNMKSFADIPLRSHSIDEIREAVRINKKQRLGLLEENGQLFIRANQGHSVKVVETESLLRPITSAEEIPICVHGTYTNVLDSILRSGINRMTRLHVHFSSGLPSDGEVISGMRRTVNVVIFLDVKKALEDGMKLYKSENNVILTEGFGGAVPRKYFQKIMLWPSRKPVSLQTFKFQD